MECRFCGGNIVESGFSGRLFCWGKCYHYLSDTEIQLQFEYEKSKISPKVPGFRKGEEKEIVDSDS
jgi:hypothetical protein